MWDLVSVRDSWRIELVTDSHKNPDSEVAEGDSLTGIVLFVDSRARE